MRREATTNDPDKHDVYHEQAFIMARLFSVTIHPWPGYGLRA